MHTHLDEKEDGLPISLSLPVPFIFLPRISILKHELHGQIRMPLILDRKKQLLPRFLACKNALPQNGSTTLTIALTDDIVLIGSIHQLCMQRCKSAASSITSRPSICNSLISLWSWPWPPLSCLSDA